MIVYIVIFAGLMMKSLVFPNMIGKFHYIHTEI